MGCSFAIPDENSEEKKNLQKTLLETGKIRANTKAKDVSSNCFKHGRNKKPQQMALEQWEHREFNSSEQTFFIIFIVGGARKEGKSMKGKRRKGCYVAGDCRLPMAFAARQADTWVSFLPWFPSVKSTI